MSPYQALETLSLLARNYKGTFEEHAHLAQCTQVLIDALKQANIWEEPSQSEETAHA